MRQVYFEMIKAEKRCRTDTL